MIRFDAKEKFEELLDFQINTKQFFYITNRVSLGGNFRAYLIVLGSLITTSNIFEHISTYN
jgi:hypothetical protein